MARTVSSVRSSVARWTFVAFLAAGSVASLVASTRISPHNALGEVFPWSIMTVLNVVCGLAVAAGAFAIAASTYVVRNETWTQLARPSLTIGCAAYVVAILGSIGTMPDAMSVWPAIVLLPGAGSPLVGSVWIIAAMALWIVAESIGPGRMNPHIRRGILLTVAAVSVAIANVQQWRTAMELANSTNLAPQWGGTYVPALFLTSSICVGPALVLLAITRFGKEPVSAPMLTRVLAAALLLYLMLRLNDIAERGLLRATFDHSVALYFWPEVALVVAAIMWIVEPRASARTLYAGSAMAILAVVVNRMNSFITAFEISTRRVYHPYWAELTVAYTLLAIGVATYVTLMRWVSAHPAASHT